MKKLLFNLIFILLCGLVNAEFEPVVGTDVTDRGTDWNLPVNYVTIPIESSINTTGKITQVSLFVRGGSGSTTTRFQCFSCSGTACTLRSSADEDVIISNIAGTYNISVNLTGCQIGDNLGWYFVTNQVITSTEASGVFVDILYKLGGCDPSCTASQSTNRKNMAYLGYISTEQNPPVLSNYNYTANNIAPGENSTVWNINGTINMTSNLAALTITLDKAGNCSARVDVEGNYSENIAFNSNTKFATTDTINQAGTIFENISLGDHFLCISCIGSDGIETGSGNCSAKLNITRISFPTITLNSPDNDTSQHSNNMTFNYTVFDDDNGDLMNVSLYIDGILNLTNTSISNGTTLINTISGFNYTNHTWQINVTDGKLSNISELRTFNITNFAPTISQGFPPDNYELHDNGTEINFTCNVTDSDGDLLEVIFYLDNVSVQTNTSISSGTTIIYTNSALTYTTHTWNCTVNDGISPVVNSGSRTFNVTNHAPTVNLNSPENNSNITTTSVLLNVTVVHNDTHNANISFYNINGSLIGIDLNVSDGEFATFNWTGLIKNQNYTWFVIATDGIDTTISFNWTFNVINTAPIIILNSPENDSDQPSSIINFNYTILDNENNLMNVSLYINGVLNLTNISISNGTTLLNTVSGFSTGIHSWYVNATDGINTTISPTRIFNVTNAPPVIVLNSPDNNSAQSSPSITFNYTVSDPESDIMTVKLFIDGILNITNTSISNGTTLINTVSDFQIGNHSWYVTAEDSSSVSTSETRVFNITLSISSITITPGIDWIKASCIAEDAISFILSINDTGESSEILSTCLYTFTDLDPLTSYMINITASNTTTTTNMTQTTTLKEAIRSWIPQGNINLKNLFNLENTWKVLTKKIFITSDSGNYQTKILQNNSIIEITNNNSGTYRIDSNLTIKGNLMVNGCIKYNCSSSCITLGDCI